MAMMQYTDAAGGRRRRGAGRLGAAVGLLIVTTSVAGCGSSGSADAATRSTCTEVSAVLADGPDPGADPVGYAEAQILPLGQIQTSDRRLRAAVTDLASAYRSFSDTGGSAAAKKAVTAASARVDGICPGATS